MSYKIYVDGQSGTTGLQIHERLSQYADLELLTIAPDKRRDPAERKRLLNTADLVFLCLPDDAARESVAMIDNPQTRVIDASTAHRIADGWVYGLPEYDKEQRARIQTSRRVAVTGCHASASILSLKPLRENGVISADYPVTLHSVTGYSGGGKNMIEQYEHSDETFLKSPRHYALTLKHKHLPEIRRYAGLQSDPVFLPIVSNFYKGLAVTLPLHKSLCQGDYTIADIRTLYQDYYQGEDFIKVLGPDDAIGIEPAFFDVQACNDTNRADIAVLGNDDQIMIMTRLDNLGKGASGAAIQCMNIMLGFDEARSLAG